MTEAQQSLEAGLHPQYMAAAAALGVLERACARQPDLWLARYNLGILRIRAAQVAAAEAALQRVIALDPGSWSARAHCATLLAMTGRSGEAVACAKHRAGARSAASRHCALVVLGGLLDPLRSALDSVDIRSGQRSRGVKP